MDRLTRDASTQSDVTRPTDPDNPPEPGGPGPTDPAGPHDPKPTDPTEPTGPQEPPAELAGPGGERRSGRGLFAGGLWPKVGASREAVR